MKTRILIADPHRVFREGLRLILESQGDLEVVGETDGGHQCVELAAELEPDVAILEVSLPHGSGLETARQILSAPRHASVVILTLQERRLGVEEALRAGVSGYVFKTESGQEVLRALAAVSAGRTYLSPAVLPHVLESLSGRGCAPSGLTALTPREREVLGLIAEGLSSKEIAGSLGVSAKTVDSHRARLMQKTGIHKTAGLVRYAFQEGLVGP